MTKTQELKVRQIISLIENEEFRNCVTNEFDEILNGGHINNDILISVIIMLSEKLIWAVVVEKGGDLCS